MNKKLIKLTEQDLHRIVKESVNRILNEHKPLYTNGGREIPLGSHSQDAYIYHYDNNGNKVTHNWAKDIRDKHNQRTWKYNKDLQKTSLERDTEELLPMLRDLGITINDWKQMSQREKDITIANYDRASWLR